MKEPRKMDAREKIARLLCALNGDEPYGRSNRAHWLSMADAVLRIIEADK